MDFMFDFPINASDKYEMYCKIAPKIRTMFHECKFKYLGIYSDFFFAILHGLTKIKSLCRLL